MSEEQATTAQAAETGEAQEANKNGSAEQQQGAAQEEARAREAQSVEELPKWAQKEIKDARKEAANNRTARNRVEEQSTNQVQTLIQERDSAVSERDEAYQLLAELKEEAALRAAFTRSGAKPERVDALMRLADREALEVDDDGNITKADEVVEAAREAAPEFFGIYGTIDGGARTNGSGYSGAPGRDRLAAAYESNSSR